MENRVSVRKILTDLKEYLKIKTDQELADHLGIGKSRVDSWIKHNKITDTGLFLVKNPELNLEWLYTSEGHMLIEQQSSQPPIKQANTTSKIAATIEPGPRRAEQARKRVTAMVEQHGYETPGQEIEIRTNDLLEKTRKVITSDTIYNSALERNIEAFYQAVTTEEEMIGMRERIDKMEIDRERDNQEIKELLLSLGATTKKRDAQANS